MFAIVENEKVVKLVHPGQPFTYNDNSYAANWCALSTQDEKDAIGLVPVSIELGKNSRFYVNQYTEPTYDKEYHLVRLVIQSSPIELDVAKTNEKRRINETMNVLLAPSDWRVVKAMETGVPMPTEWQEYRAGIRQQGNNVTSAIDAAESVEVIETLVNVQWLTPPQ